MRLLAFSAVARAVVTNPSLTFIQKYSVTYDITSRGPLQCKKKLKSCNICFTNNTCIICIVLNCICNL